MKSEMPDKLRMSSNEKKASLLVRLRFLFDHARIQMEKGNISILSKDGKRPTSSEKLPLDFDFPTEEKVHTALEETMARMTHMDQQVPMTFSMDRMISEIKEVSRPSNDARGAYRVIFPFLVFRLSQLQMLNHKLCVRWKKHCASNEDVERLGPQFARGLKAINEEYKKVFIRWRTLSPESAGISLITDDGLSHEQLEILRSGDLLKSDMTMYLHHTIPRQHCVEKIDRFLLKLKWLPISAETELVSALNEVGPGRTQQKNIAMAATDASLPRQIQSLEEVEAEVARLKDLYRHEGRLVSLFSFNDDAFEAGDLSPAAIATATLPTIFDSVLRTFPMMYEYQTQFSHFLSYEEDLVSAQELKRKRAKHDMHTSQQGGQEPTNAAATVPDLDLASSLSASASTSASTPTSVVGPGAARGDGGDQSENAKDEDDAGKENDDDGGGGDGGGGGGDGDGDDEHLNLADGAAANQSTDARANDSRDGGSPLVTGRDKRAAETDTGLGPRDSDTISVSKEKGRKGVGSRETDELDYNNNNIFNPNFNSNFQKSEGDGSGAYIPPASFAFSVPKSLTEKVEHATRLFYQSEIKRQSTYRKKADWLTYMRLLPCEDAEIMHQQHELHAYQSKLNEVLLFEAHFFHGNNLKASLRRIQHLASRHLVMIERVRNVRKAKGQRRGKNHKHRRGNGTGSHGSDDSSNNDPYNTSQDDNSKSTSEIGDMHQHPNSDTNTMESIPEVQQQQQHTASAHPSSPLRDDVQFGGVHNIKMEKTLHKIQTMYMMRCLRVREVRHRILTHLNYFRSIQKRLAIDEGLFHATKKTWKHPTRKDKEKKVDRSDDNQKKHNNHNITNKDNNDTSNNAKSRTNEGHTSMDTKKDIPLFPEELLHDADHTGPNLPQFDRDIEPRDDAYSVQDDGSIIVWDAVMGVPVLYDVAEKDMKHLERHLLRTATAFTKRFDEEREREARKREGVSAAHSSSDRENNKRAQTHGDKKTDGKDTRTDSTDKEKRRHHHRDHKLHDWQRMEKAELEVGGLDVWAVLCSLYESESEYQIAKRRLLETYFEAYQHCIDLTQQQRLAQKMIDLMAARPRLDLSPDSTSYATMYALETRYMAELADFLSEAMDFQRSEDRKHGQVGQAWMEHLNDTQDPSVRKMFLTSSSERRVGLLEFVPSLYKVLDVAEAFEACVEGVFKSLVLSRAAYLPKTLVKLKLRTLKLALESFRKHKHEFSPFPKSKHFSTVDYLNSSFMFSNPYMASHQLLLSATEREREINNNYYEQQASKSECKIQIYFNFLEVMSIRRRLLLHLYETVILTSQYIQQARRLKVDSARTIMDVAAIQGGNLLINNPRSELGLLAMMECSKHLPGAALKIIQDVKRLVLNQSDSLRVLRVALQMQVAHARVLSVVVQLHAMLMRFPQSRENPMRNVQRQVREKARKHELVHAIIKNQKVGGGGEGGSSAGDNNNVDTQAGKEGRKGGGEGAFRNQLPTMGDDYRYGESSSSMRVGHLTSSLFINLAMVKWKAKETVAFEPTASFPARYAEKMVATLAPDIYVLEVLALYDKYNTLHASSSGVFAEGDDGSPVGYIAYDRLSRSHDRGGETTLPLIQHLLHDVPSYVPMNKEAGEDFDAYAASSSLTKFMRQRMHQRRGAVSSSKEQTNKLRLVATSHVGMNRMAFSLFFHLPRLGTLLRLLRVKRAHFRPEFLRRDLLCRKVMYDVLRLSLSLSSCEQLSVYYDTPLRIAELAAHRIDYIKNELDAMPQEATLKDAYEMLVSERNILWYRHLLFTRLVYETSIVRGDYKGLEAYVKVTSRITQHEPIANKRNLFITPDLVGFIPSSVYHDLSVLYLQFTHQKERVKMDDIMAKESSFLARTVAQNVKQWQSDDFKTETNRSKRMEHNLLAAVQLGTIFDAYFLDRFSSLYNDQLSVLSSSSSSAFMDGSNISGSTNSNGKGGNNSARDRNGKRVSFAAAHGSSGCAGMQTRSDPRSGTGGGLGSATIDYSAYDIPEDLEHWQEVQHGAGIVKEAFAHCLDSRSEYKRAIDIVESEILVNVNRERQQLFSSTGKVRYSKLLSLETTMRSLQARESREAILRRQANAQQRLESIVQETAPQTFETDFDDDDAGISSAKWTRSQSSKTGRQRSSRKRSSRRRVSAAGKGDGKAGGRTRRGRSRSCSGDSNDSYGSYEGSPSGRVEGGEEDNEESDGSLEYDSDGLSDDSDDDDFDYMDEDHISSTTSYVPCMTLYVLGLMESDQLIFIRVFFVELYNSLLKNVIKNLSHRLKSITNYQDETHGISIKFKLRSSSASSASSSSIAPSPHSSPASPSFGYTHSTVEGLRYVKAVNAVSTMLSDLRRCTSTVQEIKDAQDVQRHHHFYFLPRNLMNQTISDAIRGLINHGNQENMTRLNTVRNINEQTRALVMKGERQLQSLGELCGKIGGLSFAARPSRVTEIEYGLILELQQTRNQLTMLQNELARQESMIREKMQEQYGDKTHQLSMEILHTTNRITDAKDRMKEQVSIRYHSIRREMLDRMVQKGSAPYNIKRKAMLQVAEEEKVMKQEKERLNLKRTILHMETLFKMKALASQKQFQYEMNLVANKIRAHQNLSTQIKNYKSTESVLQQETTAINLSLAKAKTMMRSLEAEVELSTREHQRLLAWQKNQSRVMSEMKTLADRFDRVSDIDFQKLEMTLSKKSMESERSKRHETHGPRRQRIIKSSYQKQIQQLDRLVYEEEKIIDLLSDKTRAVEKMLQQPADTHAHAHTHIGEVGMTLNVDVNRDSDNDGGRGQWSENNAENVEVKPNTTRRVNTFRKDGRDTENKNKNENENENENPRNGPSVHSNNPLDITQEEHGDYKQSKQELAYSEAHYRELVRENQRLRRQLRETEPTQANDHIKNQLSNSQHYYSGSADNSGGFPLSRASMFRAREKKRFNTINHPGHDRSSRRQRKPVFESQRLVFHK